MDRISGLMPQVGWSPLMTPAMPKKAPATTVEPAATAANTNGGLGADVNTQGQAAKVVQLPSRASESGMEQAVLAQSLAAEDPDPDALTGPPPTFEVTPLEAQAAALRAVPPNEPKVESPAAEAAETTPEAGEAPEQPAPSATSAPAPKSAPAEQSPAPAAAQTAQAAQGAWQATAEAQEPSLDVTR